MHSLEVITQRNDEQVVREYVDLIGRKRFSEAHAIRRANPDIFATMSSYYHAMRQAAYRSWRRDRP